MQLRPSNDGCCSRSSGWPGWWGCALVAAGDGGRMALQRCCRQLCSRCQLRTHALTTLPPVVQPGPSQPPLWLHIARRHTSAATSQQQQQQQSASRSGVEERQAESSRPEAAVSPSRPFWRLNAAELLSALLHHNSKGEYQRSRNLFHSHRVARALPWPWSEAVCDATLQALVQLNAPETMLTFARMLRHGAAASSPRLYNHILQLLHHRAAVSPPAAAATAEAEPVTRSAQRVVELMRLHDVLLDVSSWYHLTCIYLHQHDTDTAAAHHQELSRLLQPPVATATAAQLNTLFRLWRAAGVPAACERIMQDMRRCDLHVKPWMQRDIDRQHQRHKLGRIHQRTQKTRANAKWWVDQPTTDAAAASSSSSASAAASPSSTSVSTSTFRVGLEHRASQPLSHGALRSIDDVDRTPPSVAATFGPHLAALQALLHAKVDTQQEDDDTEAELQQTMVDVLRECYEQEDSARVLQFYSSPGIATITPLLLNLMLCTLTTASLPQAAGPSSLSYEDHAAALHRQLGCALALLEQLLQVGEGQLLLPPAVLLLRGLAYLPMPLSSPSSLSFSSFSSPTFELLPAQHVATRAAWLYTQCVRLLPASSPALPLLYSFAVRAQCKDAVSGTQLLLSLPGLSSDLPTAAPVPLSAACYTYLIYHQVRVPLTSLQTPYRLFSLLLSTCGTDGQTPPVLSLYYLLCGELLRGRHTKARAIYRETVFRYGLRPPACMTDALVLGHRVLREQAISEDGMRQRRLEEDGLARLMAAVCVWLQQRGDESLDMGREAMEAWWEMRCRRRLAERRDLFGRDLRLQQDQAVAEQLWPVMQRQLQAGSRSASPSLPALTSLALFLSSSPLLSAVLAAVQQLLSSAPYAHFYASDSSLTASISTEQALYQLSCLLSHVQPSLPRPPGTAEEERTDPATRLSVSLYTMPPHSHAAFLRRHLLSRVLRCVVYSLTYATPCASTLQALQTAVQQWQLELDAYCCHVLLVHSLQLSHPSLATWYELGMAAYAQLQAPTPAATEETGFGPGSHSPLAYSTQALQLCRLLYEAGRGADADIKMQQSLLSSLLPSSRPTPFLDDAAVLALIDYAVWSRSAALLQRGLSALALDGVEATASAAHPTSASHRSAPLPRSFSALTRGFIHAVKGMRLRGWTAGLQGLTTAWLSAFRFSLAHYGKTAQLLLSVPAADATAEPSFLYRQQELLYQVCALCLEQEDDRGLWFFYRALTEAEPASPSMLRLLQHLPVFIVPLKAALLSGRASQRRAERVLADLKRWFESRQLRDGEEPQEDDAAVRAILHSSRFPPHTGRLEVVTVPVIVSRYSRRLKLCKELPQPAQAELEDEEVESSAHQRSAVPLQAAVWCYLQLLSDPAVATADGLPVVCRLLTELQLVYVRPLRRRSQLARETVTRAGDEVDMTALQGGVLDGLRGADGWRALEEMTDSYIVTLVAELRRRVQTQRQEAALQILLQHSQLNNKSRAVVASAATKSRHQLQPRQQQRAVSCSYR